MPAAQEEQQDTCCKAIETALGQGESLKWHYVLHLAFWDGEARPARTGG